RTTRGASANANRKVTSRVRQLMWDRWSLGPPVTPNRPISDDHFTVDGTLVQRWASLKGFVPKEAPLDRAPPPDVDCAPDQPPQAETTADTRQKARST